MQKLNKDDVILYTGLKNVVKPENVSVDKCKWKCSYTIKHQRYKKRYIVLGRTKKECSELMRKNTEKIISWLKTKSRGRENMKIEIVKYDGLVYDWETLVNVMNDGIRNQVHNELAPCSSEEFLERYLELDPEFENRFSQMLKYDEVFAIDKGWIADDGSFNSYEIPNEYFSKYEDAEKEMNQVDTSNNEFVAINAYDESGEYVGAEKTLYAPKAKQILTRLFPESYNFEDKE